MGEFVKGEVVVAPFPFSDLTAAKKRPALVVASLTGDDVILCQLLGQHTATRLQRFEEEAAARLSSPVFRLPSIV